MQGIFYAIRYIYCVNHEKEGRQVELALEAAEIRGNNVFLHPADDPEHTVCVRVSCSQYETVSRGV